MSNCPLERLSATLTRANRMLANNLTLALIIVCMEPINEAASLMGRRSAEARIKQWGKREFVKRMQDWGKLRKWQPVGILLGIPWKMQIWRARRS